MEEDKEILYLLDIAINSYIENDILRLDVSDTTKNRLKRDLRKKFRDEDFIYDIKNNIGLIPKSKVKDKIEELNKLIIETQKELGSASKEYTIYVYQKNILQELLREE